MIAAIHPRHTAEGTGAAGGMRDRWLRALRQATRAVALVEERLGADPTAEASATRA